jgi:hypothetical protein
MKMTESMTTTTTTTTMTAAGLKRERLRANKDALNKFKPGQRVKWEESNNTFASGIIRSSEESQYFVVRSTHDGRLIRIEASEALSDE